MCVLYHYMCNIPFFFKLFPHILFSKIHNFQPNFTSWHVLETRAFTRPNFFYRFKLSVTVLKCEWREYEPYIWIKPKNETSTNNVTSEKPRHQQITQSYNRAYCLYWPPKCSIRHYIYWTCILPLQKNQVNEMGWWLGFSDVTLFVDVSFFGFIQK